VGPSFDLDTVVKRKTDFCSCRESNPSRPARSLATMACYYMDKLWWLCDVKASDIFCLPSTWTRRHTMWL